MKKNHELRIKVSEEEKQKIKQKAEAVGLSLSSFVRFLLLNSTITPTDYIKNN